MYTGDMIVNLYSRDKWRSYNYFNTRNVFPSDSISVIEFIKENFPSEKGWVFEAQRALLNGTCLISVLDNKVIGFACYDCIGKGYFGPFGVSESRRGYGVGTELICECFDQMKCCGYGYAIIGCVDDSSKIFYEKVAKALTIPNSELSQTLYKRKL